MSSYLESKFLDPKSIVSGIVLAIIITGLGVASTPLIFNLDQDLSNRFESPIQLTSAMESQIDDLIQITVQVGTISSAIEPDNVVFGFDSKAIFRGSVFQIRNFKDLGDDKTGEVIGLNDSILDIDSWILVKDVCCTNQERSTFSKDEGYIDDIHTALMSDLQEIKNYENISNNFEDTLEELESKNGEFYWEISHLYKNGKFILIRVFGNTIVVQTQFAIRLRYLENGFSVTIDSQLDRISVYRGTFDDIPFQGYQESLDNFLLNVGSQELIAMETEEIILTNQTTIQILLYFKNNSSSTFGIRETQRKMSISNPSIVSFHLKKLIEMNLITKNANNRYHITQEGIDYDSFKFSVSLEPKVIRGHFVPHLTNLLVFTASILATVLTLFLFHLAVEYLLTILYFSLLTIFGLLIREWLYFQKELKNYTNLENKNRLS